MATFLISSFVSVILWKWQIFPSYSAAPQMWGRAALLSYDFESLYFLTGGWLYRKAIGCLQFCYFEDLTGWGFNWKKLDRLTNNENNDGSPMHPQSTGFHYSINRELWVSVSLSLFLEMCFCTVTSGYLWRPSFNSASFICLWWNQWIPIEQYEILPEQELHANMASTAPKTFRLQCLKMIWEGKPFMVLH